ncbi:MAG: glycosyltransferase family 4 protein [Opitutales bacterium]
MRTLLIGKTWPEPGSSAGGARTLELLRTFREAGWPTTFATANQKSPHAADLEALGIDCHGTAVNDAVFDAWVRGLDPDLVVFDRYMTEEQFGWRVEQNCPEAMRVLDTTDLHSLREARRRQLKEGKELDLLNDIALREVAAIFRSDLSLVISEYEIGLLKDVFQVPVSQLAYLPLMLPESDEASPGFDARAHFVMIGNYLHEPNWDAVQWCCREIWPLIRAELPAAQLHIFGAYEPAKARQLHNEARGIFIRGRTDDAIGTLGRYRLNLAPLRFGAGQKGKVADGFLSGTPTISTPIAAESMNGPIEWGCPLVAEARGFAQTAVAVHDNAEAWNRVRRQGFAIARQRLSAKEWKPKLVERLKSLVETGSGGRHQHFIGRLLRHHQHRSTEFMSRWIAAKNK